MNHKQTLYFIAKCLTISLEDKNRREINKQLKLKSLNWDYIIKVSTGHYVLPALYCNLKRVDFLHYLPAELVNYMQFITRLNRDRNQQIIQESKELNSLLLANNIKPIFLKGTANILCNLYGDIAERMVGDIDIIISEKDYLNSIKVLKENGYLEKRKHNFKPFPSRHHPRLICKNKIGAIEIHSQLLDVKNRDEFNYKFISKDTQFFRDFEVLSFANKLNLSIISNYINDNGYHYKTINLRNAYDVFLLSKKTNAQNAINKLEKLTFPLNCFLAVSHDLFNKVKSLDYNKSRRVASYLSAYSRQFSSPKTFKIKYKLINRFIIIKSTLKFYYKCIFHKEFRDLLIIRIRDKNWRKEKLIRFREKIKVKNKSPN